MADIAKVISQYNSKSEKKKVRGKGRGMTRVTDHGRGVIISF